MKILVHYPTRGRPAIFLTRLREYIDGAKSPGDIIFLVSYDADDTQMTEDVVAAAERMHPNVRCVRGNSKTKIEACNANVNDVTEPWNIVLLISDDMFLQYRHWDERIKLDMALQFPDTDGCLWYHDGSRQRAICTLSCIGRRYYNRFGWIYRPEYRSFHCDNEFTYVASAAGKIVFIDTVLARHEHPAWGGGMKRDATYIRNNPAWAHDEALYNRRKLAGFPP